MDNWLEIAERLAVGRSRKVRHDCSPNGDPSLSISHEPECYRAFCFRCKEKFYQPKRLSLGERIEINKARSAADREIRTSSMPKPKVKDWADWPVEAQVWLLKAGIGQEDARRLGIYYHEASMRVVLPYPGTHHWQARAVMDGHKPKYISDGGTRMAAILVPEGEVAGGTVVLTEDLLSACKMRMAGHRALPLLGTVLHDEHLVLLLAVRNVSVWLDGDKPGQDAAATICKRLSVFGIEHRNVVTDKDPKLHTRAAINKHLEAAWR